MRRIVELPHVRCILVCEDVRREESKKEILIGVYPGGIRFNKPAPGKLRQLCFRVELETDIHHIFRFRLVSPSDAVIIDFKHEIKIEKPGKGVLNIMDHDRSFYEEGEYSMLVAFDESELEVYDTVEVTFAKT